MMVMVVMMVMVMVVVVMMMMMMMMMMMIMTMTMTACRFGERARQIKTTYVMNAGTSIQELRMLLAKAHVSPYPVTRCSI
jgi:cell division protein YceG involved in septum cleavage